MSSRTQDESRLMVLAMVGAAAVTAQFVSGKATRDALFLTSLDFTTLPTMLHRDLGLSPCSWSRSTPARPAVWLPATLVPAAFAASGVLFLVEWLLRPRGAGADRRRRLPAHLRRRAAAGLGLLADRERAVRPATRPSGGSARLPAWARWAAWSSALVAERVGARSARRRCCRSWRSLQFVCAWFGPALARTCATVGRSSPSRPARPSRRGPRRPRSGLRVVAEAPHLRHLAYARAARHDQRGARRLPVQGAGDRDLRPRRPAAAVLRPVLRRHQRADVRPADVLGPRRCSSASASRSPPARRRWRSARRQRRSACSLPGFGSLIAGARRRVGVPQLAVPRRLRALLHADAGRGEARRQVDHRRRLRSRSATPSAAAWCAWRCCSRRRRRPRRSCRSAPLGSAAALSPPAG